MFFGGGNPFGFGGPGQEQQEQDDETLYTILDVSQDATPQQIKQKYQELSKKYQQGQEADPQKLQQINQAFQIISEPTQRKHYDQQLSQQKQIFEMMHGKAKGAPQQKQKPKMQPTKRQIQVSLEKIYTGGNVPLHHQRARTCDVCNGAGGTDVKKCAECKGEGAVVKLQQVGPGMFARGQETCPGCKGMGDIFGEGGRCQTCVGRKIVKKEVDLEVPIPIGVPEGHVITLQGEGNQLHNVRAGDLILIVAEQPHETFTRKGADLFIKKTVSLVEALLGFNFEITHLDTQKYTVYTNPGDIVGDGHKKVVKNLGMPFVDDPQSRGNLIIEFKVEVPKRGDLTPEQLKALSASLPGTVNPRPKDTNYEMLQDFDRQHINSNEQGGKRQQDEEQGQQGGMQCQPQ